MRLDGDLAEFESRKRTVTNLTRQTESRFAAYLETTERTVERVFGGLEVMALRAGTLLEQEQVRLLSARVDALRARVAQLEEELTVARQRVSLDDLSEEKLDRALQQAGKELDADRRRLRKAEADLIDVVAEAEADSLAIAVARQEITAKSVEEARAELEVAAIEVKRDILLLRTREAELSLDPLQTRVSQRQELMERINSRMRGWSETGEQGLAESASAMAGEAERELIEKRALVAARLLSDLQALRRSLGDLVLLQDMAIESLRARQGRLQGTLSNLASQFANGWDTLKRIATASIVTIGDTPVTIAGLFRVLVILTAAFWLSRILRHALDRMGASKRTSMSQSSLYSLGRLLHYVIIFAGIIIGLSSIGLDFTNLALVAGALGVGIGFGLQSVVSNFVSGLILLFERSLNVGDFVELDSGVTGVIREINVRSTLLNTNDNVDILVPNSEFVNGKLINWTLREAIKRIHVPFGVAYGTDKELTKKAVLEAAQRVPLTYTGPGRNPQVWLVGFGDSSLDYELVVWLGADAVRRPAAVQAAYLWEIETSLGEHGIEIPFPQRDLHLRSSLEVLRGNSDSATNK